MKAEKVANQMTVASEAFADLINEIDSSDAAPSKAVVALFRDRVVDLARGVDAVIRFGSHVVSELALARYSRAYWDGQVQKFKAAHETFKTMAKEKAEEHFARNPGVKLKGALGAIRLQKSRRHVVTVFEEKELLPALIEMFGIEPRFVKATYELRTREVERALAAGEKLDWAKMQDADGETLVIPGLNKLAEELAKQYALGDGEVIEAEVVEETT